MQSKLGLRMKISAEKQKQIKVSGQSLSNGSKMFPRHVLDTSNRGLDPVLREAGRGHSQEGNDTRGLEG